MYKYGTSNSKLTDDQQRGVTSNVSQRIRHKYNNNHKSNSQENQQHPYFALFLGGSNAIDESVESVEHKHRISNLTIAGGMWKELLADGVPLGDNPEPSPSTSVVPPPLELDHGLQTGTSASRVVHDSPRSRISEHVDLRSIGAVVMAPGTDANECEILNLRKTNAIT